MNTVDNSPLRPAVARWVFKVALVVVPQASRDWLEDMKLEAGFIEPDGERIRWALGALVTALRFRLGDQSISKPQTFALASALLVTVLAVVVIMPQSALKLSPAPVLEPLEEAASLADRQVEPPLSIPSPSEAEVATPLAQTPLARERDQDMDTEDIDTANRSEARAAATLPNLPESGALLESDEAVSLNQKIEDHQEASIVVPSASSDAEADVLGFASESRRLDELSSRSLVPSAVTEVQAGLIMLDVQEAVWLELIESSAGERHVVASGQVQAGERFALTPPFYLQTNNAGAIAVTLKAEPEPLGPQGVALGRLFRLKR